MKISTSEAYLQDRDQVIQILTNFWDKISYTFDETWGPHIHHGYFDDGANLTLFEAQELLTHKLIDLVDGREIKCILDAGCGMGVTSIYLTQRLNAVVNGVTLSPEQVEIARKKAKQKGIDTVEFQVEDVHSLKSFPDGSFDLVWSLESCEQFYDKPLFLQQANRVLQPNGYLMLATWCSGHEEYTDRDAEKYKRLCKALDLPYMPTIDYYARALEDAGFNIILKEDWSDKVAKTWSIAPANFYRKFWNYILKTGFRGFKFVQDFKLMDQGYKENRVRYGVFLAQKK